MFTKVSETWIQARLRIQAPQKPGSLRFMSVAKSRESLFARALEPFAGMELSKSVYLRFSGPFPRDANSTSYGIYLWRLTYPGGERFIPEQEILTEKRLP
jgi:hypothetical protein